MKRSVATVMTLGFVVGSGAASAAAPPSVAVPVTPQPLVDVELSGWLRTRSQWLHGADLGNGVTGLPHAVSVHREANTYSPNAADLSLTDVRLRLEPRLKLSHHISLGAQLDAGGGVLVGATDGPVWLEGDGRHAAWVAARRAWGSMNLFGLATLTVGRVGDHFGLGAWRNDGRDRFNDWQSDVDRVALSADVVGLKLMLARDSMVALPTPVAGAGVRAPLQDSADVTRWLVQASSGQMSHSGGFVWSAALSYQDQAIALRVEHAEDAPGQLDAGCPADGGCLQLVPRDAMLITPQGYLHWRRHPPGGLLDIEPTVLRLATLENTDVLVNTDTSKVLIGGAAVGQLKLTRGLHQVRLGAGVVTGDSTGGFGVRDQNNFTALDPQTKQMVQRDWVTGMSLHRGYLVDGLLFRELIGAVANAWFARPAWRLRRGAGARRTQLEIGCLIGGAFQSGATPGRAAMYGVEPELRVGQSLGRFGDIWLNTSYLLPGAAFDAGADGRPPAPLGA